MTQTQINECAKSNFEKEMTKHKEFFRAHNVFTRIYTDEDLKDIENIFACDMIPILRAISSCFSIRSSCCWVSVSLPNPVPITAE